MEKYSTEQWQWVNFFWFSKKSDSIHALALKWKWAKNWCLFFQKWQHFPSIFSVSFHFYACTCYTLQTDLRYTSRSHLFRLEIRKIDLAVCCAIVLVENGEGKFIRTKNRCTVSNKSEISYFRDKLYYISWTAIEVVYYFNV